MSDDRLSTVWVFVGERPHAFPSGVFSTRTKAVEWIRRNKLTGTLTEYPLDESVLEWAMRTDPGGYTIEQLEEIGRSSDDYSNFSHAAQAHLHFKRGECRDY